LNDVRTGNIRTVATAPERSTVKARYFIDMLQPAP
jgi:hypothetical protein